MESQFCDVTGLDFSQHNFAQKFHQMFLSVIATLFYM